LKINVIWRGVCVYTRDKRTSGQREAPIRRRERARAGEREREREMGGKKIYRFFFAPLAEFSACASPIFRCCDNEGERGERQTERRRRKGGWRERKKSAD